MSHYFMSNKELRNRHSYKCTNNTIFVCTDDEQLTVACIKLDLVQYVNNSSISSLSPVSSSAPSETLLFTKCELEDVHLNFRITVEDLDHSSSISPPPTLDERCEAMSVASTVNTIGVEPFIFDDKDFILYSHDENDSIFEETVIPKLSELVIERKTSTNSIPLTSEYLKCLETQANVNHTRYAPKELADFRIKHAMDYFRQQSQSPVPLAINQPVNKDGNNYTYFEDLHALHQQQTQDMDHILEQNRELAQKVRDKEKELLDYRNEEKKWNKVLLKWQRDTSDMEANNIELEFNLEKEMKLREEYQRRFSKLQLEHKMAKLMQIKVEDKYHNLLQSLTLVLLNIHTFTHMHTCIHLI